MAITDYFNEAHKNGIPKTKEQFFEAIKTDENFVGHLYDLDYDSTSVLVNDHHKNAVKGVPHGCFLMAIYTNEIVGNKTEGILLRVIGVADIPQKKEIIESITDSYIAQKEARRDLDPDAYTKNFYQWNGLKCRVLGTFFFDKDKNLCFGTDIENFIGAHNYRVYKPQKNELNIIINENASLKDDEVREKFGKLRYSSSNSYDKDGEYAPDVYLRTNDIIARRSAFFGMTRMGKSNTIKIIISAIESLNKSKSQNEKIGQIIFDINGEYTFSNEQDKGSIYEKFKDNVVRYSTSTKRIEKGEVEALQYNFYEDKMLEITFEMMSNALVGGQNFIQAFKNIKIFDKSFMENDDLSKDEKESMERNRKRKIALYKCILYKAGFKIPYPQYKLYFSGVENASLTRDGLTLENAVKWFENNRNKIEVATSTKTKRKIWDNDYSALYDMLMPPSTAGGFKKLIEFNRLHSPKANEDYVVKIDKSLREGNIVLIDLSTTREDIQQIYITRLCDYIFHISMDKFTNEENPDYIQMYFEEAHNIFPKDDKDLKNIYNRIAKEGAKLKIGISYSTQEVSSIAPSILKNTQNWFISHLNNKDEVKNLEKYYDFADFSNSIIRNSDIGFARVKLFSNNFIIPVQIDKFEV